MKETVLNKKRMKEKENQDLMIEKWMTINSCDEHFE
jgi:hypothetical protein